MQEKDKIINQAESKDSSQHLETSSDNFDLISEHLKQYLCLQKDDLKDRGMIGLEIDMSKFICIPNFALLSVRAFKGIKCEIKWVQGNVNSEAKLREILSLVENTSWVYAEHAEWRLENSIDDTDNNGILPTHDNRVSNWLIVYDFDCKWKEIGEFITSELNVYLDDICLMRNGIRWYPYRYKRRDVDIEAWKRDASYVLSTKYYRVKVS